MRLILICAFVVATLVVAATANSLAPLLSTGRYQEEKESSGRMTLVGKVLKSKMQRLFGRKSDVASSTSSTSSITPIVNPQPGMVTKSLIEAKPVTKDSVMSSSSTKSLTSHICDTLKVNSYNTGVFGKKPKKKLLVLMCDTGGGHRASAQALDQAIQDQFPNKVDVEIMDLWTTHAAWPYNQLVPVYRYLAKHPMLWRGFYAYGAFPLTKKLTELHSDSTCYKRFHKAIEASDPDFVVSVHPLCQLMPITIVHDLNKRKRLPQGKAPIPFVTVVTDLGGAHVTWFDKRCDACYVPSQAVHQIALRRGLSPDQIIMKGLPVRPSFWKAAKPKVVIRKALGLPETGKTVLLMGGGDGVGGLSQIAQTVARSLRSLDFATQLVVICGHNKQTLQTLQSTIADTESPHRVFVKGFVSNIDEYMAAADCLITKAGPGTIAESMVRGLPLVLSSYLPGQVRAPYPVYSSCLFDLKPLFHPMMLCSHIARLVYPLFLLYLCVIALYE